MLSDLPAERAILAGVFRYGSEAYYDVCDIISESNSVLYSCMKHVLEVDDTRSLDAPTMMSAAKELGLSDFFNSQEVQHMSSVMKFPVLLPNVRKFAAKVRKLEIARMMHDQLELTQEKYLEIKGDEPIAKILGMAEEGVMDITSMVAGEDESPTQMFDDVEEHLEELCETPVDQIGISTGFPRYDYAIGGGFRKGTVNVIGARPKTGKTLLLDTEMRKEDHQHRMMAMLSQVPINDIETGAFAKNPATKKKVMDAAREVNNLPYYFKSIGGASFEEQTAIMRRWISRVVGLNDKGKANDCVIIYDYLKLMDSAEIKGDMKEFQILGFMITALHNLSLKYEVPILTFIQLNRDGITKESTDTAEEIAKDGPENGNRKLVPVIARHGEGLEPGDYINAELKGPYAKVVEGKTAFELDNGYDNDSDGDYFGDDEDVPFK
jgi:replicative DNA helicase